MIKIFTISHKRPDFLELQLKSFNKHIKAFEFIVFNNATFDLNKKHYNEIHEWCNKNNIKCIDVIKDTELINNIKKTDSGANIFKHDGTYADAGYACTFSLEFAWKNYISKLSEKICIIDSDMFFIKNFEFAPDLELSYIPQSRDNSVLYMWNGIVFADLNKLPEKESISWWVGYVNNVPVDVGGQSHFYLTKHKKNLKIIEMAPHHITYDEECSNFGFNPPNYEYIAFNGEYIILHHRGGSNWHGSSQDYIAKKFAWLKYRLS